MTKGSRLYPVFKNRCPKCHEGKFWPTSNPFKLMFIHKGYMNSHCSSCGFVYTVERGFWYGAMYVSYALGVVWFVSAWVAMTVLFPHVEIGWTIGAVVAFIILMAPVTYYLSRPIWSIFFIGYKKKQKLDKFVDTKEKEVVLTPA